MKQTDRDIHILCIPEIPRCDQKGEQVANQVICQVYVFVIPLSQRIHR